MGSRIFKDNKLNYLSEEMSKKDMNGENLIKYFRDEVDFYAFFEEVIKK